ncbi:MAG: helix-hairpin-helix domain-containing protein [Myxococcales bacterium]|nr:helix-hairpin-helix domain-containing protein [Myxococcales bacterium]MCB9664126.1 helix-hairpin-helix domain-containing protein [Alphaproteobacteria bacterium]
MSAHDVLTLAMPLPRALALLDGGPPRTPQAGGNRPAPESFEARLARVFSADGPVDLEASDLELVEEPPTEAGRVRPTRELTQVTHRISSQFVDVIAMAATQLLGGHEADGALSRIGSALDALGRLAAAAEDGAHEAQLATMRVHLAEYDAQRLEDRGHTRFRDALRGWLPAYASFLGGSEGDRLRDIVEFDMEDAPVFRYLEGLKGIGPGRLRRLYAAGLFTAEVISEADPAEMALVTGLPRDLAREVVEATRSWRVDQRRRSVLDLPERIRRFVAQARGLAADQDEDVRAAARQTVHAMRVALWELEANHDLV